MLATSNHEYCKYLNESFGLSHFYYDFCHHHQLYCKAVLRKPHTSYLK